MAHILSSAEDFKEKVLDSNEPILVDFFATWCGPCQMLAPIIDELSHEVGETRVFKLDVDQLPEIAGQYGVMSIPTIKVFKNGKIIQESVGVRSKQEISRMIQN